MMPTATVEAIFRLFRATEKFELDGKLLFTGPAPFSFDRSPGLLAREFGGAWVISHPEARHDRLYRVVGVEAWMTPRIEEGTQIGLLVEEIAEREEAPEGAEPNPDVAKF